MGNDIFRDLIIRGGLIGNNNQLKVFKKIDFTMYPARAFSLVLQKIYSDKGPDYIKELAKIMGKNGAEPFIKELKKLKLFVKEDYKKVQNLIEISGFGRIDKFTEDKKQIIIKINNHPVINASKELYGKKSCTCEFYGELYCSFIKTIKESKNLKVKNTKSICKGDKFCEWVFQNGNN